MQKFEKRECVALENEGQQIFGMLHRPLHVNGKTPAVLICHGFAGNKLGRYRLYVSLGERLAKAGIAALRIDYRGSGESEGDFTDMTVDGEVSDTLKALNYLREDSQIDAERIGLLGNSFGGAIAILAAHKDRHIKSLALLAALFHSQPWQRQWEKMLAGAVDESVRKEMSRMLDGNAPGPGFYKSFFQLDLEKEVRALHATPLLHIHSEKDDRVGIEQADHYQRCREGAQSETHWIRLQKCDHDFSSSEERNLIIEETAKWFVKTL